MIFSKGPFPEQVQGHLVEEILTPVCSYRLMRTNEPDGWYVERIVIEGMGIRPNGEITRTPMYDSVQHPELVTNWGSIVEMKAATTRAEEALFGIKEKE